MDIAIINLVNSPLSFAIKGLMRFDEIDPQRDLNFIRRTVYMLGITRLGIAIMIIDWSLTSVSFRIVEL